MVDIAISNFIKKDDILITADYGLACIELTRNAYVISSNGNIYNNNANNLLQQRYLSYLNRKDKIKNNLSELIK